MKKPDTRTDKKRTILTAALELLKEDGGAGLTMRKLSERAGMRLSNLQYYFKTREDVLTAMVALYFGDCEAALRRIAEDTRSLSQSERTRAVIVEVLHHGHELSDMCRIFRELWAISTRSEAIHEQMMCYYRRFAEILTEHVLGEEPDPAARARVSAILLPFFEGYSITAPSLLLPMSEVADTLTEITLTAARRQG